MNPLEGGCFPVLLHVERSPIPLSHALRQAMAGADPHVLLCVTVPGVLCPTPQPFPGTDWVTPHHEISAGSG